VIINNAYSDQRFFSGIDRRSGFRTHSMICTPLRVNEQVIGIFQAINRKSGQFTDHDLQLMQALGGPLAAAIENANLHADVLAEIRRTEALFAGMAEGLITVNLEGIITRANSAFATLLKLPEDEVVGQSLRELFRAKKNDIDELIRQTAAADERGVELILEHDPGDARPLPLHITGFPVLDGSGKTEEIILFLSDLTQILEVERMRDDLFDGIVHELRTPLATILMYSRLLQKGRATQPDRAERFLGVIERESDRLQRTIRQMLDIAKIQAGEVRRSPESVWLNALLEETLPPWADKAIQKGLLFRQRIEPDLPPVMGTVDGYNLIFNNLLDNAIKFTPSGSVQVAAWKADGTVVIEISDDGIGIPAGSINNLFRRFYRTRTAVERSIAGSGLGLYMVKESLRNYNGSIEVKSTLGKGSVFTIKLPIAQA
jgi:two-component system phosphate regulon sensor histidine kinase PhoR